MPASINGCGTMYCGNAAAVAWEKPSFSGANPPDHDALVCITFLMMPLAPLRACHVFDQLGGAARELRLRWSAPLVLRALLRPWLMLAVGVGGFFTGIMAFAIVQTLLDSKPWKKPADLTGLYTIVGLCLLLPIGLAGLRWFSRRDRSQRDIRLVIGRYAFGSSDPALWHESVLARADVTKLIGGPVPRTVAEAALREGHFSRAMLAARLLVGRGDPAGAALSERILAHPTVKERLSRLRKEPWRIAELVPDAKPASPQASPFDGILFYDGRRYSKELLDRAGGPGFAAFVRENPKVVRAAPSSLVVRGMLALLILWIVSLPLTQQPAAKAKDAFETWLGTLLIGGLLGWVLYDAQTRTVAIGDRCLQVTNQRVLLDALQEVKHSSHLGIFPIVDVRAVGALVRWPYREGENEELERILKAAIALKTQSPDAAAPGLESSHVAAHLS